MIDGLRKKRKLRVDRKDAPELPELLAMQEEGLVASNLVEVDDQYSYLEFWWTGQ